MSHMGWENVVHVIYQVRIRLRLHGKEMVFHHEVVSGVWDRFPVHVSFLVLLIRQEAGSPLHRS